MNTFEEKFTAWLDGALAKEEAGIFDKDHLHFTRYEPTCSSCGVY